MSTREEAMGAIAEALGKSGYLGGIAGLTKLAEVAYEAAEPHIRAAERERCAQLAEQVDAFYDAPCPSRLPDCIHQDSPFADLLRGQH